MRKSCFEKEDTTKGSWSKQEDKKLNNCMHKHGEGSSNSKSLTQASGLLQGNFGEDEEDLIIRLHALCGDRWTLIAGRLPGRTDSEVKSYWDSHISKRLIMNGQDPNKHQLNKISSTEMDAGKAVGTHDQMQASSKCVNLNVMVNHGFSSADGPENIMSSTTIPDLNLDLTLRTPQVYPKESAGEH